MKKSLCIFLAYLLLFALAMGAAYILDQKTAHDRYACLTDYSYNEAKGGYVFSLERTESQSIVASNAERFEIVQDGAVIFSNVVDQQYSKLVLIPLRDSAASTEILVRGSADQTAIPGGNRKINLYLMNNANAIRLSQMVSNWNHIIAGMLLAVFVWAFSLYVCKHSEVYLLHTAVGAVLNVVNLAIPMNLLGISMSFAFNRYVRPLMLIICCTHLAYQMICLYIDHAPAWLRRMLTLKTLLPLLLSLSVLQLVFPRLYIYTTLRLLICIPVVLALGRAAWDHRPGALLLLISSAVTEGVTFYVFLLNKSALSSGWITAFWRPTELLQSVTLLLSVLVVNYRFASKFSEEERLSAELKEMNANLEEKVAERTEMLQEQQKHKLAMMQNVFHDLRSPIFMLQEQLNELEQQGAQVSSVKKRLEYLSELVSKLFLLAKLEEGKVIFDEDEVRLDSVVQEAAESFAGLAREKGLYLRSSCEGDCVIWGDELRIRQMLHNLVQNALQHTTVGGVTITACPSEGQAVIRVRDSGEGIRPEECRFVFERYYRSKTSRERNSSGLGLAIAKEIIEAHQGTIRVESRYGEGAEFIVTLPLLEDDMV